MAVVGDRLWLWGHEEGSHNGLYNLEGESKIAPAAAAREMGISNVIMVRHQEQFDARHYADSLRDIERVVWSIVGVGGLNDGADIQAVREMAAEYSNWCGVMMDDFFFPSERDPAAIYTVDDLKAIREQLQLGDRRLDLWVVLYDHQLHLPLGKHLEQCDVVAFWTWNAKNLDKLEENFSRAEALSPASRRVLGCYMWDYGDNKPIPLEVMQQQCETGLRWLQEGRIEGMIFLASCICDLNIEAVEWTREWIKEVAAQPLNPSAGTGMKAI